MDFSVLSEKDAIIKFKKAKNKKKEIQIIADLTCSTRNQVADFLGVVFIKKHPYVVEKASQERLEANVYD